MSYSRIGGDSDLYVYRDLEDMYHIIVKGGVEQHTVHTAADALWIVKKLKGQGVKLQRGLMARLKRDICPECKDRRLLIVDNGLHWIHCPVCVQPQMRLKEHRNAR